MGIVQVVIDDSTSKAITGVYDFRRDEGGAVIFPAGASFPLDPNAGEFFWRTDENKLYRRNNANAAWEALTTVITAHGVTHISTGTDPIPGAVASGASGLLTGSDKAKLDGLPTSAVPTTRTITAGAGLTGGGDLSSDRTLNVVANADGSISVAADSIQVGVLATDAQHGTRSGGTLHAAATTSANGFMSSGDKTKLDGIATGATNTPLSSTAPVNVTKAAASAGVATAAARQDHKHDVSTAAGGSITVGATGAEGSSTSLARADHTHTVAAGTPVNVTKATAAEGTAATFARSDHKHDVATAAPSTVGTANSEGASTSLSRADHVHSHGAQTDASYHAVATTALNGFMSSGDKTKLDGIVTGATNTPLSNTVPVNVTRAAASAGTAVEAARQDHKHDIGTVAPSSVGTANTEGTRVSLTRADHVHKVPFSVVQTVLGTATGAVSVNSQKITSLGTPTAGTDAANKDYVDLVAQGLNTKRPVKAVATSNVATLSGTAQTVDGIALDTVGDRVLLTEQGTGSQNGIWVVASGAWTRPNDFAAGSSAGSSFVFVQRGTTYADTGWVCTTDPPSDIVDTNSLAWAQFSAAGQVIAGTGLTKTGNTINVIANADGSIVANANDIQVGLISDAQHGSRSGGTQHAAATTSVAGFLSASDKTKLDGLPSSAVPTTRTITAGAGLTGGGDLSADRTVNVAAADASIVVNADSIGVGVLQNDTMHGTRGGGTQHSAATTSVAGFMSSGDKTKLDGVATGATNTPITNTAPVNVTKAAASIGTSGEAARQDHKHDVTTAAAVANPPGTSNAEGASTSLARADHTHAVPAYGTGAGTFCQGNDSRLSDDRTASGLRTASTVVAISSATAPTSGQVLTATSGTAATWQTPVGGGDVTGPGASTLNAIARYSSTTGKVIKNSPVTVDDSGNIASAGTYNGVSVTAHAARHNPGGADALAMGVPVNVTKAAAAEGTATSFARSDHKHDVTTAAPANVGSVNAEGSSTSLSRADHVHAHGDQAGGTLHAVASGAVAGFMSAADKTKLDSLGTSVLSGGYAYFAIWAEENAALSASVYEWSFGAGGASGAGGGIQLPFNCELYALSLDCNGTSSTATVSAQRAGTGVATISVAAQVRNYTVLGSPVAYTAGQSLNFYTTAATASSATGNRVTAFFRVPVNLTITGSAHGDLLYNNGTDWVRLAPGSSGQVLQTNGAGSAPTWVNPPSGTGVFAFPIGICDTTALNVEQNDAVWGSLVIPTGDITIGRMQCQVAQAAAGNVYFAIYDVNLNKLGDETTGVSCATTGLKTANLISGVTLTAGTPYYFCIRSDANGSRFTGHGSTSATVSPQYSIRKDSAAAASFPSSFVAPAANTETLWIAGYRS